MTAIRIDDLPVDADTHNDVDLERAGQHRRRDLREPQRGHASGVRDLRLGASEAGTRRAGPNAAVAPADVSRRQFRAVALWEHAASGLRARWAGYFCSP